MLYTEPGQCVVISLNLSQDGVKESPHQHGQTSHAHFTDRETETRESEITGMLVTQQVAEMRNCLTTPPSVKPESAQGRIQRRLIIMTVPYKMEWATFQEARGDTGKNIQVQSQPRVWDEPCQVHTRKMHIYQDGRYAEPTVSGGTK